MLPGFTLGHLPSDIFTLSKGDNAGEQRVSLKARLIKVDWINIGQAMVFKAERMESTPPSQARLSQNYIEHSF